MTKAASSLAPRLPRLLPALLLLLAALLATIQLLVSDPDAGSGMGGTGRFGGESGLGGTGGPLKLGFDRPDDEGQAEQGQRPRLDAAALMALASTQVDVKRLRTEPEALPPSAPAATPPPAAVDLLSPAALRAHALHDQPPASAANAALSQAPPSPLDDVAALRADAVQASATRVAADLEVSATQQQLLLAEAVTQLDLPTATPQTTAIDVHAERRDERLRLSLPARPDLPDRPNLQAPRVPVPPRGIPAPPVRPMRL